MSSTVITKPMAELDFALDDFYGAVYALFAEGPRTSYQEASLAAPWFTIKTRNKCYNLIADALDGTELEPFTTRISLVALQILEAAVATGKVGEHFVEEWADVAGQLASKLTENMYLPVKKGASEVATQLSLLELLEWRLPRASPYYILAALRAEIKTPPKDLEKKTEQALFLLCMTRAYCNLRARALAASVVFDHYMQTVYKYLEHTSVYRIPDVYKERATLEEAFQKELAKDDDDFSGE